MSVKKRFTEKLTFEERLGGHEEVSPLAIWEKNIPERRNCKCNGPEVSAQLACPKTLGRVMWLGEVIAVMCSRR